MATRMDSNMPKPLLLLINPNTTDAITEVIRQLAITELGDEAAIIAVTAPFGARYISSRATVAIAAHAVLEAYAAAWGAGIRPDAIVVACFGDPGIDALRELTTTPVFGFAECGLIAAAADPGSFAIATIGEAWRDMLAELASRRGLANRLAGIIVLDAASRAAETAAPTITSAARSLGANRIIIGGTGLIPILDDIAARLSLPVVDPHRTTLKAALQAAKNPRKTPAIPTSAPTIGLSPALTRLLQNDI